MLELSELTCGTSTPLANVFCDGQNFFLAFDDGEPKDCGRKWRWFSALLTAGDGVTNPIGRPCLPAAEQASADLLADPGFEEGVQSRRIAGNGGGDAGRADRPGLATAARRPVGEPTGSPGARGRRGGKHVGRVSALRQAVPVAELPAGSRWRLTAWVKGENIQRGDVGWKVGTLRFAPVTDRITYASCPELLGTFSWKQVAVEFTVPEKLRSVDVEVGLNGATGKMWIDDVRLERRE